jgi:cytochrome b561
MVSIPAILPRNLELSEQFHQIHILGAMVFAGLVVFHAAAALVHHLVWRDDVLELMAPVLRRRAEPSDMGDEVLEGQP